MASKSKGQLKLSRRIASVWVVISMGVAILIGIVGFALSANGTIPVLEGGASESVMIQIANFVANYGWAAALFAGVVLAGILAATMSTSDSQLLAASSSISENILKGTFKLNLSKKMTMVIARLTVIGVSIVAIFMALDQNSTVFGIVSFAWAGFGAAFGPVMLLALFWKRSNLKGAIAGMIAGTAMIFIWEFLLTPLGGFFAIYELLPAFVIAIVVNVIVSLATKAPDDEIVKEFEHVQAMHNID
jgi:sodium/proline symporter